MWLTTLKKAIILEEIDQIDLLISEGIPTFNSLREMEEAAFLLQQAKRLLETKKTETSHTLLQLTNTLNFLKSSQTEPVSSLNLKF